jgi:hypothetical protein
MHLGAGLRARQHTDSRVLDALTLDYPHPNYDMLNMTMPIHILPHSGKETALGSSENQIAVDGDDDDMVE